VATEPAPVDLTELLGILVGHRHGHPWRKIDIAGGAGVAVTASRQIIASDVREFGGYALAETTNAAGANVRFHDGSNATGDVFARVNLATNESTRDTFGPHGIKCDSGNVYLEMLTGSIEGVIFVR
jgi:hypothetical protein